MSKKDVTATMTLVQKLRYFCGGRVTVGTISQVRDKDLKKYYVARVRGIIVGDASTYKHETPDDARAYGKAILAHWRDMLARPFPARIINEVPTEVEDIDSDGVSRRMVDIGDIAYTCCGHVRSAITYMGEGDGGKCPSCGTDVEFTRMRK